MNSMSLLIIKADSQKNDQGYYCDGREYIIMLVLMIFASYIIYKQRQIIDIVITSKKSVLQSEIIDINNPIRIETRNSI